MEKINDLVIEEDGFDLGDVADASSCSSLDFRRRRLEEINSAELNAEDSLHSLEGAGWLSLEDFCQKYGISSRTVSRRVLDGRVQKTLDRVGKTRLYRMSDEEATGVVATTPTKPKKSLRVKVVVIEGCSLEELKELLC